MKQHDGDDFAETAGPLFDVPPEDPFADSVQQPEEMERVVAGFLLRHKGRARPIPIAELSRKTGQSDRQIKGIVESLIMRHNMLIGGRREDPVGYFLIQDSDDLKAACGPFEQQVATMQRRVDKLRKLAYERGILS